LEKVMAEFKSWSSYRDFAHGIRRQRRANPKGIPVLYLSTRAETAMSEVRPWIGLLVSCAVFETTRELRLVDLSVTDGDGFTFYFEQPDATKKEEAVWADIDAAFSEPVTSQDDTADYGPTQVISEWFRTNGFDGARAHLAKMAITSHFSILRMRG